MEQKPKNPFRPKSMSWALYEEDWSDLTIKQIAEVFEKTPEQIYTLVTKIKRVTGYSVPYVHIKPGPKEGKL